MSLKLKVSPKCTDYKGVAIDIVKGDEEYPVLLLEEQNNKVSIYLWRRKTMRTSPKSLLFSTKELKKENDTVKG